MSNEWDARNDGLAKLLADLVIAYAPPGRPLRALDVGTQQAMLPSMIASSIPGIQFRAVEPGLAEPHAEINGIPVDRASCDALPFPERSFEVVTLASVFEHIDPARRAKSLAEIHRVLVPGGILVGQIPNMYFPIEPHSRLPLQQYLPRPAADGYLRVFSPMPWRDEGTNWFRVGPDNLRRTARSAGLRELCFSPYNPPRGALPGAVQRLYPLLSVLPLGYCFAFCA